MSTFAISVGRRPKRSASRPKMNAPSARRNRVSVIAHVTVVRSVPNSFAMSLITNTMMKKSKASSVQPR